MFFATMGWNPFWSSIHLNLYKIHNCTVVIKTLLLFCETAKEQNKVESMPELFNKTLFSVGLPGKNLFRHP